jgi:ribonuclease P protein component
MSSDAGGPKAVRDSRFNDRSFGRKRLAAVEFQTQTFDREDRLRKRADFIRRSPRTRKIRLVNFLVVIRPNTLARPRLGLAVGKNRGGAVERNRIKRLLREFFRQNKKQFPPSHDIIIIALEGSNPLTYHQVVEELTAILV